ncbi:MAG: hypothetical protein MJY89_07465 [Bacteroidales bacterium]|nr:hypothetical protein [Bacteroidales bacterium]
MFVKNSNFVIYLFLSLLVGFVGSALLFSNSQSSLLSGDISKASRYYNVKEDPAMSALEEKIQNDKDFQNLTRSAYAVLDQRVSSLEDLTDRTISTCADIPELESVMSVMSSLNAKASNTKESINKAVAGVDRIAGGKNANEYEQVSNNVYVGFQKIEKQLAIGKVFVDKASSYIEGKSGEDVAAISRLVSEWSLYCMQDARLNNSRKEIEFWGEKLASQEEAINGFEFAVGSFERVISGFNEAAVNGFSDAAVNGFNEAAVNGFSDAAVNGFNEAAVNGFSDAAVNGFNEMAVNGFNEMAVNGFNEMAVNGFSDAAINAAATSVEYASTLNGVCMVVCGLNDAAINGFSDAAVNGFSDAAVNGFNEMAVNGFNEAAVN